MAANTALVKQRMRGGGEPVQFVLLTPCAFVSPPVLIWCPHSPVALPFSLRLHSTTGRGECTHSKSRPEDFMCLSLEVGRAADAAPLDSVEKGLAAYVAGDLLMGESNLTVASVEYS